MGYPWFHILIVSIQLIIIDTQKELFYTYHIKKKVLIIFNDQQG